MNIKKNDDDSLQNKLKEKIKKLKIKLLNNEYKNSLLKSKNKKVLLNDDENNLAVIKELEYEIDLLLKNNLQLREEKLLALADNENFKKRIYEEIDDIKRYCSSGIVEKLLPILDNFERAVQVTNITSEVKNFLMGFEMIYRMFKVVFEEEGISEMKTKIGDNFNSNFHSAIEIIEVTNIESGCIVKILQKGYMIYDRVLRHASVQVAK